MLNIVWSEQEDGGREGRRAGRKKRQMQLSVLCTVHTLHAGGYLNSKEQVCLMGSAEQNIMSLFSCIGL